MAKVGDGVGSAALPVAISPRVPRGAVWIEAGHEATAPLSPTARPGRREGLRVIDIIREFLLQLRHVRRLSSGSLLKILVITVPLIIAVAFYTLVERKVIGWMHVRHGPQFIGGVSASAVQAFADVFKMLFKELILPSSASPFLYRLAPLLALAPAFAAWAVIPFDARRGAGQRQCRPAVPAGADLDGRLRHHPRRLGVELEVRLPGRDALGGAGRQLRNRDGLRPGRRAGRGRQHEPDRDRAGAGRQRRLPASGSVCRCSRCS